MDEATFNEVVKRLKKVNSVVGSLDESIRNDAFQILRSYVDSQPAAPKKESGDDAEKTDESSLLTGDLADFFTKLSVDKPADAVYGIAAWWFGQYGSAPLTREQMSRIADQVGVTVPERPDMTLKGAKIDGKALFRRSGRGAYVPTVHGELHFKNEYKVKKGKNEPPATDA